MEEQTANKIKQVILAEMETKKESDGNDRN